MPARSSFPVAKAALFGGTGVIPRGFAELGESKVQISYGDPGVTKIERESVFAGGTGQDGQSWAPYGRLAREEEYEISFWVHVAKPGSSQQEATERAHDLFGLVEELVRPLAPTIGNLVTGMWSIEVMPRGVTEFVTDQGCVCLIAGAIACKARI